MFDRDVTHLSMIEKRRGTFLLQIGSIRNHQQFDVKLSAIEGLSVGSHS
jgi:hypothetical protein